MKSNRINTIALIVIVALLAIGLWQLFSLNVGLKEYGAVTVEEKPEITAAPTIAPTAEIKEQTWEYLVITYEKSRGLLFDMWSDGTHNRVSVSEHINELGKQGWELIDVVWGGGMDLFGEYEMVFFFKRGL